MNRGKGTPLFLSIVTIIDVLIGLLVCCRHMAAGARRISGPQPFCTFHAQGALPPLLTDVLEDLEHDHGRQHKAEQGQRQCAVQDVDGAVKGAEDGQEPYEAA